MDCYCGWLAGSSPSLAFPSRRTLQTSITLHLSCKVLNPYTENWPTWSKNWIELSEHSSLLQSQWKEDKSTGHCSLALILHKHRLCCLISKGFVYTAFWMEWEQASAWVNRGAQARSCSRNSWSLGSEAYGGEEEQEGFGAWSPALAAASKHCLDSSFCESHQHKAVWPGSEACSKTLCRHSLRDQVILFKGILNMAVPHTHT